MAPGHLRECAWLSHLPGKWCHCSSPSQQVTLRHGRPQGQMDDALGKQGEKSVGHWIVGSGIRKGEGLSTAFKRCISIAVFWAGGLWCRLLPCKEGLGMHIQPRTLWFLCVLHVLHHHRPLSPLERDKTRLNNTHSAYLCQNGSFILGWLVWPWGQSGRKKTWGFPSLAQSGL